MSSARQSGPDSRARARVAVLLGAGTRLFDGGPETSRNRLELTRGVDSPTVTHLSYRVIR